VTADAVYVTSNAGKVFCIDRAQNRVRWSNLVAPGSEIYSSPAVAVGKLFTSRPPEFQLPAHHGAAGHHGLRRAP